jgi:nicotinamidase-related amidase
VAYVSQNNLEEKSKTWGKVIAPYNTHKMILDIPHSALLVIDMQNFFLDPKSPTFTEGGLAILPNVKKVISAFRERKRPVIYTAHEHKSMEMDGGILGRWWEGMCMEGTKKAEISKEIYPRAQEKIVKKHRYSAFYNTDLEIVLRCLGIKDLVISGIMTNLCCESTTRDAYFRDYKVFFLLDGTGTVNEDLHLSSLKNLAFGFAYVCPVKKILEMLSRE